MGSGLPRVARCAVHHRISCPRHRRPRQPPRLGFQDSILAASPLHPTLREACRFRDPPCPSPTCPGRRNASPAPFRVPSSPLTGRPAVRRDPAHDGDRPLDQCPPGASGRRAGGGRARRADTSGRPRVPGRGGPLLHGGGGRIAATVRAAVPHARRRQGRDDAEATGQAAVSRRRATASSASLATSAA